MIKTYILEMIILSLVFIIDKFHEGLIKSSTRIMGEAHLMMKESRWQIL